MIYFSLAFLAGHCGLHSLARLPPFEPWFAVWLTGVAIAAVLSLARRLRRAAALVLCLALGFGSAWWHASARMAERWPESRSGADVLIEGRIASIVESRDSGQRFHLDVKGPDSVPSRVELTWYEAGQAPVPGELWQLQVRLRVPRGFVNPGGYDYEAQLLREGIGATGYVRQSHRNRRLATSSGYLVLRARAFVAARLELALPRSAMLGIVQGLAVGETSRMRSEQWRVFARTGTTHLMAISGMHIGMVALLAAWLAGRIARRLPLERSRIAIVGIEATAGMCAALVYSSLAGFSVPTQRTLIMLCVYFGARLLRRELAVAHGLAIALVAVLLVDPFAPLAVGFWLSFGAVAAILLALQGRSTQASRVRDYLHTQLAVTIGLTPLVIAAFGSVSLIAPLVNLIAIPFFTLLVVPLVLLASMLVSMSLTLGAPLAWLVEWLLSTSWPVLQWASAAPLALWPLPHAPWWALGLLLLGAGVLLAPGIVATRIAGLLLCAPAIMWSPPRPASGEFTLTMLDVGQGLAVVIHTATHTVLYDAGPSFRSGRDIGEMVIVPYLQALGVRRLDVVVASHGDDDHVGGLLSVLSALPVEQVKLGPTVTPPVGTHTSLCARGLRWRFDAVEFSILHPAQDAVTTAALGKRRNDASCVLRVQGSGGSALLLGDVERRAEEELLVNGLVAPADVVVVPHHGSRTSSSLPLVAAAATRYALVSAGFGNSFGFPKREVVARWRESGAQVLTTAGSGAIDVRVSADGVAKPIERRQAERRYWRH